jgi:hypothetical protein
MMAAKIVAATTQLIPVAKYNILKTVLISSQSNIIIPPLLVLRSFHSVPHGKAFRNKRTHAFPGQGLEDILG